MSGAVPVGWEGPNVVVVSANAPSGLRAAGRLGPLFAGVWLFFLIDPLLAGWDRRDTADGWIGMVATVSFAVVYMWLWLRSRRDRAQLIEQPPLSWSAVYLSSLVLLGAVMVLTLDEPGIASVVYVGVALIMVLPLRAAAPLIVLLGAAVLGLGALEHWGSQAGTTFGLLAASVAVFGLRSVMRRNIELVQAHRDNAELAVENERSRFARDLHDILGHSLTVITIKAELAGRLFDADPERARAELTDLERLSRDALADVRRAVEGYRDLTLPGEIARARTALAAAQIDATLPGSTDEVPTAVRELFAWTVREAVTNVIRHSEARHCEVRLTARSVEVRDDGIGADADLLRGSGLLGLQERATSLGATLVTRVLDPGWAVEVILP